MPSRTSWMRAFTPALFVTMLALASFGATSTSHAQARTVVIVHGYDPGPGVPQPAVPCPVSFGGLESSLKSDSSPSLPKTVHYVGYYKNDWGCNGYLNVNGNAAVAKGTADFSTPIDQLGKAFSEYLARYFAGQTIDIVAHSMGGLIVRWALTVHSQNLTNAGVRVEDVITGGTPHEGTKTNGVVKLCDDQLAQRKFFLTGSTEITYQCQQMMRKEGSPGVMLAVLNHCDASGCPRTLPRAHDWTLLASKADELVTVQSAQFALAQAQHTPPALEAISHLDLFQKEAGILITKRALAGFSD